MIDTDTNSILRHEVYLDRLNSGYINSTLSPALDKTSKLIRRILNEDGLPRTPKQLVKLESLIAQFISDNNGWKDYTKDMQEAALYESQYLAKQAELTPQSTRGLLSFINEQMMVLEGRSPTAGFWSQYVTASTDSQTESINNILKVAYSRGETLGQVLKQVKQAFSEDGKITQGAKALARTGFNHYVQQGRRALVSANPKQYEDAIFVAIWDNRTTLTCMKFANIRRFKANDPKLPVPPLHYGCRSTLVYGPAGFKLTGDRAAIGGKNSKAAGKAFDDRLDKTGKKPIYKGKRDLTIFEPESFPTDKAHEAWFRQQPRWFIESSIGKKRAALFVDGKLSLKRFSDMPGIPLTLAQLNELDSEAFKRANINP